MSQILAAGDTHLPTWADMFGDTVDTSPFALVIYAAILIMGVSLVMALILLARVKNDTSKIVLADAIFYPMIGIYVAWTILHPTQIAYEIVILGAMLGLLSSVSLARILTKGRR